MHELKIYQCDYCGKTYSKKFDCQKCERFHRHPVEVASARYLPNIDDENYPEWVNVQMSDGKIVRYKYSVEEAEG